jgi:hypothetical protein
MSSPTEPPESAPAPSAVPEATGFRFDAFDERGETSPGTDRSDRLWLVFDEEGIEAIARPSGQSRRVRWSEVTLVSIGEPIDSPSGGVETPIRLQSRTGSSCYLIRSDRPPSVQGEALIERVARWSATTGVGPGANPASVPPYVLPPPFAPPLVEPAPPRYRQARPKRIRRMVTLAVGMVLIVSGLALALWLSTTGTRTFANPVRPHLTPDQRLVAQLMLTRSDLPAGWNVQRDNVGSGSSSVVQRGEVGITRTLAGCMGIADEQAAIVLGGSAADQTAQSSSPIFVAPSSSGDPGFALELQTAAAAVRTHHDEQVDFSLLGNPRYPTCAAAAVASELQLGINATSGANDHPGPATVSVLDLPAPAGEQLSGLVITFTVSDGPTSVPVEVETIALGSDRIEASLQSFAIAGQIPGDMFEASVQAFEQRIAIGGQTSVV